MSVVVGWVGDDPSNLTGRQLGALERARLVVAPRRLHEVLGSLAPQATVIAYPTPITELVDLVHENPDVVVVASGDPGFFGISRVLADAGLDLEILPGPTTAAVAAARLGRSWEGASVVSFVGRDHDVALQVLDEVLAGDGPVIALLCPGQALVDLANAVAASGRRSWLAVALGTAEEVLDEAWQARSEAPRVPSLLWIDGALSRREVVHRMRGLDVFADRPRDSDGVFTSLEVRLVAVARLAPDRLPPGARVLEVGAGTGYVGLTLWRLRPDITIVQLEPRAERAARAREHARALGARVEVLEARVEEHAPEGDYDAAFVGGGGPRALRATLDRVRGGGRVVATFVDPGRAAVARELLGNLELIEVADASPVAPEGVRFVPRSPIFLAWR
ncbi:precorrin-6y C5,15-methyltransferase (decarboxylating), CbiE subunit [Acidimicrobium ferrooxidans DSM 10331]|uniref:Precorrin-6y C5,15-methyltransferase (Decarboxylating), CbiE subunit n=1 Tax=Acidimicrobium ferrooxidans (strain DSM 10331 / JCM 15462 / NBRC 103882 / ICP) TaxID=525909 RepID=C7LYE7_ACIFD|nr:bifunctional cobalt-precorrin-7 (C(5))-methyltransferase CbiE/decarboxylating cobalt-precorrin-6B (C(15))-methyltransferase CbiT [Acidimicrobium ferrooxidans]ACU53755.1 precorrin-6y C5,15-methyltransferase (decarboxylating), CbiE subunit [Acidimicrobium ferrooxidans DSM 10331]